MVVDKVLNEFDDERLVMYVVWTPVLGSDTYESAVKAQFKMPDERVLHYWDGDRNLGSAYGRVVPLPSGRKFAWDIYFTYDETVRWEENPPEPRDWAHQLGRDERSLGDGQRLADEVRDLLYPKE